MAQGLTLLAVHAHPDDEAIGTGGVLARYAAEGVRTVLVTCTNGEVGEIADPALATAETLADVRLNELKAAVQILGISQLYLLGYRDSGMAGTADNDHPRAFHRADLEDATARLVEIVRRERPQVLVTYDENGFYGHPDHIMANRVTVAAFEAAADAVRFSTRGPPWQPQKLYYTAMSHSAIMSFSRQLHEHGIDPPFEVPEGELPEIGIPDEQVTTLVDVGGYVDRKQRALLAHATQMGPEVFFARLEPRLFAALFGCESFQLVRGPRAPGEVETDLFAGLG